MQLNDYATLVCLFVLAFVTHCALALHCHGRDSEPLVMAAILKVRIERELPTTGQGCGRL